MRKLKKVGKLEEDDDILSEQLDKMFIEVIDVPENGKRVNYLPHFAVFKEESETTKLRVVYDASA